jgi:hypothetical protein
VLEAKSYGHRGTSVIVIATVIVLTLITSFVMVRSGMVVLDSSVSFHNISEQNLRSAEPDNEHGSTDFEHRSTTVVYGSSFVVKLAFVNLDFAEIVAIVSASGFFGSYVLIHSFGACFISSSENASDPTDGYMHITCYDQNSHEGVQSHEEDNIRLFIAQISSAPLRIVIETNRKDTIEISSIPAGESRFLYRFPITIPDVQCQITAEVPMGDVQQISIEFARSRTMGPSDYAVMIVPRPVFYVPP